MVFEKVRALIAEQLNIPVAKITEQSEFLNGLDADSLDIVQMLISMETEFGIEFDDDEIKTLKTVGDVVRFIEKHKR